MYMDFGFLDDPSNDTIILTPSKSAGSPSRLDLKPSRSPRPLSPIAPPLVRSEVMSPPTTSLQTTGEGNEQPVQSVPSRAETKPQSRREQWKAIPSPTAPTRLRSTTLGRTNKSSGEPERVGSGKDASKYPCYAKQVSATATSGIRLHAREPGKDIPRFPADAVWGPSDHQDSEPPLRIESDQSLRPETSSATVADIWRCQTFISLSFLDEVEMSTGAMDQGDDNQADDVRAA